MAVHCSVSQARQNSGSEEAVANAVHACASPGAAGEAAPSRAPKCAEVTFAMAGFGWASLGVSVGVGAAVLSARQAAFFAAGFFAAGLAATGFFAATGFLAAGFLAAAGAG